MNHKGTYQSWQDMKQRCYNSAAQHYKHYGARGITVCERWKSSFENFLADMGPRPPGMTIDRNNNDGNYESDNCRWATRKEQRANQRQHTYHRVEVSGVTMLLRDAAILYGMNEKTVSRRINRMGWDAERALTTPPNASFRRIQGAAALALRDVEKQQGKPHTVKTAAAVDVSRGERE